MEQERVFWVNRGRCKCKIAEYARKVEQSEMPDELSKDAMEKIFVGFVDETRGKEIENRFDDARKEATFL